MRLPRYKMFAMLSFEKIGKDLARLLFMVASVAIIGMMLLTTADVILRYFRVPIPGTYELVSFFGAVAVSFAMAHTSVQKGHVAVSLVVRLLPKKLQAVIGVCTSIFGILFFALISWQSIIYGNNLRSTGEVSLTLELPFYPFVYGVGLSAAAVCLILIANLSRHMTKVFEK